MKIHSCQNSTVQIKDSFSFFPGVVSVHGDTLYVFCGFILEGHTEQAVPESELGDRLSGSEKGVIDLLTIEDRHNYAASDVNSVFALDFTTRYAHGILFGL